MYRRAEVEIAAGGGAETPAPAADQFLFSAFRPSSAGDLDQLFDHRPVFRRRTRGYDRAQVDSYVSWSEAEIDAARRQCDYLLSRYGDCAAALAAAQRARAAPATGASTIGRVSLRLGEMLRLASEEAEAITAAGVDEAERIVTEARAEAAARLQKVAGIREAALAAGNDLRAQAQRDAERLLRDAARRRDADAAEAATALAAVQAEVDDLRRQRDGARESLHRLTAQIGQVLQTVASGAPEEIAALAERRDHAAPSLA